MSTTSGGTGTGSGVMMSNLPLVFCKGLPATIDSLNAKELQNFLVFVMRCVHNVSPIQWSHLNRPQWWSPEVPLSPIVLSKRFRTPEWQAKLKAMVIQCYMHYDAVFLLQFSGQLEESVKDGFRMGDNSDGTTSLYDRSSGKLLVTFRNENKDYDLPVSQREKTVKSPTMKRPQLLPQVPKEKEPPKEALDTSDKMVERPTSDIFLCDHCGAEFATLGAIKVHEDQCIIGKEAKGEKVIQNDIQELKDIDQNKYLWYLGLVSSTDKVRPPNVTPAKQYPPPKRAPVLHVRKTAGVPFSSILGRQIFTGSHLNGKELLNRYEDLCHTCGTTQATPSTSHPSFNVTYKRPGSKLPVPWVHSYSFTALERREQLITIQTGLTKDSRHLLRQCKQLKVVLKRLDPKEIEEWTRPKSVVLHTSLTRLPVLSMPFTHKPRFNHFTGTGNMLNPVPIHRLRAPPPLVPINPAIFRQMYRPAGVMGSGSYTIQKGIIRFNAPTPANMVYCPPAPPSTPRQDPSLPPVVVDLCSSDEEVSQPPKAPFTRLATTTSPTRKPGDISVVPLKNLLEPQVILQEPPTFLRFRNMHMFPSGPRLPSLAVKPPSQVTIRPQPRLMPTRTPIRPALQLKPPFLPVPGAATSLNFSGTPSRPLIARLPTFANGTHHTIPISSAQIVNLGREIVVTSSKQKEPDRLPKVAPLSLGSMPAEKKEAMNEALKKLNRHSFPNKQPIQLKFSSDSVFVRKDYEKKTPPAFVAIKRPVAQNKLLITYQSMADQLEAPKEPPKGSKKAEDRTETNLKELREESKSALKANDEARRKAEEPIQDIVKEMREEPKATHSKPKGGELKKSEVNKKGEEPHELHLKATGEKPNQGVSKKKGEEPKCTDNKKREELKESSSKPHGEEPKADSIENTVLASANPVVVIAGIPAHKLRAKRSTAQLVDDECKELRQHGLEEIMSSVERTTRRRTLPTIAAEASVPPRKKRKRSLPSNPEPSGPPKSIEGPEAVLVMADRDENSNKEAKPGLDWMKDGETSRGSWTPVSSKDDHSRVSTPSSSLSPGADSETVRRMKRELQRLHGDECKELAVKGLHTLAQTTGRVLRRSVKQLPSS